MLTLGIETSCDETSAAIVDSGRQILSNVIFSQTDHSKFGGVVPEVASRVHLKTILPVYEQALAQACLSFAEIDLIAATMGPGLVGPLLVGLSFAKGLAFAGGKKFVAVNHIEGHLAANILEHPDLDSHHLTLIVSGGHTMLVEVRSFGDYHFLGQTRDDAAGEAFDKVAKLLGLGYPGGAKLDQLARQGDPAYMKFPRAMIKDGSFRFSYSGLKTAVVLHVQKLSDQDLISHRADIAASFQEAAVEVLVHKAVRAAMEHGIRHITLSGGVAANSRLRSMMSERIRKADPDRLRLFYPSPELCTDNAAMIAAAGYYQFDKDGPGELAVNAVPYLKLI
ncbi:MAG: tRNA (adenosine(37)-N6)-threonylcarbamoyltransferase complex transferase subunit TsaD [Candidatus Zixiibacteriota bacterium]